MSRSSMPFTLAAIAFVLALLSGAHAYNSLLRTVPALVAVRDIEPGTEIRPEDVRVIRIPAGGRPPRSLWGPGQIAGMHAAVPLFAEQVITSRHITATPPSTAELPEPGPGQRIISVPIRSEAALGGAARPGDLVDVVAAWPGQDGKPGPVEVLMVGVRLVDLRNSAGFSAGSSGQEEAILAESRVPASVLLLVNSQQARALVSAVESKASIYLWMTGRAKP